jgi:hypothetical protein
MPIMSTDRPGWTILLFVTLRPSASLKIGRVSPHAVYRTSGQLVFLSGSPAVMLVLVMLTAARCRWLVPYPSLGDCVLSLLLARVWSCGICGGQSGDGADFLRVLRFPLPIFIPPVAPRAPSSIIWGWYNRPVVAAVPSGLSLTPLRIINRQQWDRY